ncbi:DUF6894 family protein [Roseococcus sp. SYP-B2431]|uniref:DUF6894 family protein n=1 Tax=Roseococcus sp. SYP-B2431 TaxID=2496640 RepID=UPI0026B5BB8D
MTRFYFHVYDDEITMDSEGESFSSASLARSHAIEAIRCMAAANVSAGHLTGSHRIEISEAGVEGVQTVRFDEAITIRP